MSEIGGNTPTHIVADDFVPTDAELHFWGMLLADKMERIADIAYKPPTQPWHKWRRRVTPRPPPRSGRRGSEKPTAKRHACEMCGRLFVDHGVTEWCR